MKFIGLLIFLFYTVSLKAEELIPVYNIHHQNQSSYPQNFELFQGKMYFTADDGRNGYQLWSCDSNDNVQCESNLIKNICSIFVLKNKLYFFTGNYYDPKSIWEYKSVNSATLLYSNIPFDDINSKIIFGGKLYYSSSDMGFWEFDGNNQPRQIAKIALNYIDAASSSSFTVYNNKLYFVSADIEHGNELWCCDSLNEPSIVTDINPGPGSSNPIRFTIGDNKLYFMADDGIHGEEMWVYDGNNAHLIGDIKTGPESSLLDYQFSATTCKNKFYFRANDGIHGHRLWMYDGVNPPEMVDTSSGIGFPSWMFTFKDKLYYYGYDKSYLYVYDGINPPSPLINYNVEGWDHIILGDFLYFIGHNEHGKNSLWKCDGINPPVNISKSISTTSEISAYDNLFNFNNHLYFTHNGSLWKYENDSASYIAGEFTSNISSKITFNDKLYYTFYSFINNNKAPENGSELWKFDGTKAPEIVADLNKKKIVPNRINLKTLNNKLYFTANETNKEYIEYNDTSFRTLPSNYDKYFIYSSFVFKNYYYYIRENGKISMGLYRTDGIYTYYVSGAPGGTISLINDNLYFGISANGLFKYDGDTLLVKLNSTPNQSYFTTRVFNNKLLFFTENYPGYDTAFFWEYDLVNQPRIISKSPRYNVSPSCCEFKGKFYYTINDEKYGTEIWQYDGYNTPELIEDIYKGPVSSRPSYLTVYKNKLFFTAEDSIHGEELWEFDGVNAPKLVTDIVDGKNSSSPSYLKVSNGKLYFTASTSKYGNELWSYDGINKPKIVSDLYSGKTGSTPIELTVYNDNLYLSAVTENDGRQLYKVCLNYSSIDTTVCKSYNFNGTIISESGRYYDTVPGNNGNDSIIRLDLTIQKSLITNVNVTTCNSYTLSDKILSESGIYYDTIPSLYGCDSIIKLKLTIKKSTTDSMNATACNRFTSPSGKIWTTTGAYTDTIPNSCGCDSIITINLTVNHNTSSIQQPKTCNNYTSPSGKYIWEQRGTYLDTIPNACGCDSIITVELNLQHIDPTVSLMLDGTEIVSNDTLAHHQWVDCDEDFKPIAGQTGQSFTPAQSANYAVVVSYGWCTDTSECVQVSTTGIEPNIKETDINIYPNPTIGKFTIDLGQVIDEVDIIITNIEGRVIQQQKVVNAHFADMEIITSRGFYIMTIIYDKTIKTFSLIKK